MSKKNTNTSQKPDEVGTSTFVRSVIHAQKLPALHGHAKHSVIVKKEEPVQ